MKYEIAMTVIKGWLEKFSKPVVMSSFGKDSMAMMFIIFKLLQLKLPVIYHRDPWDEHKHEWADRMIHDWKLEVYDYPPAMCRVKVKGDLIELCPAYQIGTGENGFLDLPKAILEPEHDRENWHCGREIMERPKGTFDYPWNLTLIGHKSSDVDRFYGPVKLKTNLVSQPGLPTAGFPLKDWTDDDVWSFIENFDVPFQENRYADRKEISDKTNNNDYLVACTNCIDPRKSGKVFCPLVGHNIDSVAHRTLQVPPLTPHYIK